MSDLDTKNRTVLSPITGSGNTELVKQIKAGELIDWYTKILKIDVSPYITVSPNLYICKDTGFRFFYPESLAGDSIFYQQLQEYEWYYMPWKWEHEEALKHIGENAKILEVGCGGMGFMERLCSLGYQVRGLELNEESIRKGKDKGLDVLGETIQEHAKKNELYDVVCSFQVLEHIFNVGDFLNAMTSCIKPGGKLIIGVPNNDSFIKYEEGGVLNFPPHHMGWWDKRSLASLPRYFKLGIPNIKYEPLQAYHFDWYINMQLKRIFRNYPRVRTQLTRRTPKKYLRYLVKMFSNRIRGHSMLAIYTKEV